MNILSLSIQAAIAFKRSPLTQFSAFLINSVYSSDKTVRLSSFIWLFFARSLQLWYDCLVLAVRTGERFCLLVLSCCFRRKRSAHLHGTVAQRGVALSRKKRLSGKFVIIKNKIYIV